MPIYMNYPGAKGDVSSVDHGGWIEILEMNFDVTKKDKKRSGQDDSEEQDERAKVEHSSVIVRKVTDSASASMINMMVDATKTDSVVIEAVKENDQWWYRYTLFGVTVHQFTMDGQEADVPEETVTLKCDTLRIDTVWVMKDNVTENAKSADWWACVPNPESDDGSFPP